MLMRLAKQDASLTRHAMIRVCLQMTNQEVVIRWDMDLYVIGLVAALSFSVKLQTLLLTTSLQKLGLRSLNS
jgi:hypothetical protein